MSKKSVGYLQGNLQSVDYQRDKDGQLHLSVSSSSYTVKVPEMKDAAKDASECLAAIERCVSSTGDQGRRWSQAARDCFDRFYKFHHPDHRGQCFATYGMASAHAAWLDLCDAMAAIGEHCGWAKNSDRKKPDRVPQELLSQAWSAVEVVLKLTPGKEKWEKKVNDSPGVVTSANQESLPLDYVTLLQVAPLVGLSKRQLERYRAEDESFPTPDIAGGKGRAHQWRWSRLRKYLQTKTDRTLPPRHPAHRVLDKEME